MKKCENDVMIIFFILLFFLSSFCIGKIQNKSTNNVAIKTENKIVSNNNESKKPTQIKKGKKKDPKDKSTNPQEKPKEKEIIPLKLGSKGEDVKKLQNDLNKFGYKIKEDGNFGASTEIAIYDFQKKNNLNRDGVAGKTTLDKLSLEPTEKTMYNPKDNIFSPVISSNNSENFINKRNANSQTDYYIWVNTNTPKTYIFKGYNHHWKLIKSMPCTVGRSSTPTIKGTFKVGMKGEAFIVKKNPRLMCKYFTQIHGNYLFHTVLLNRNGTIANGTLGAKISHGCIRLSIENAKYIYNEIPKGSTIYIN